MTEDATPQQPSTFVRGNDHLDRLLSDPQLAADVADAHAAAEETDRVHAMNLAMIRKAAQMTQAEVAEKLGSFRPADPDELLGDNDNAAGQFIKVVMLGESLEYGDDVTRLLIA